jgi:hypothetical protein
VNNAFTLQQGQATKREEFNTVYALSDDVTLVKGSHQLGFGRADPVLAWRLSGSSLTYRRQLDRRWPL